MIIVGDLVGEVRDLRFQARLLAAQEPLPEIPESLCVAYLAVPENAIAALESEIQTREGRIAFLKLIDDPQRL